MLEIKGPTALWQGTEYDCTIGRRGIARVRREGDGSTPAGTFPVRLIYYRDDRIESLPTALPVQPLRADDGWCDSAGDAKYNQHVKVPYPGHSEALWRADHLYDLIFVLGYNDAPVVANLGSAIFLHLAADDFGPTEGCIGLRRELLLEIAASCGPELTLRISE